MKSFRGQALSWELKSGVIELALHRAPCNELGSLSLEELEKFVPALANLQLEAHALIIYSEVQSGFSAGADLRELYLEYSVPKGQGAESQAAFVRHALYFYGVQRNRLRRVPAAGRNARHEQQDQQLNGYFSRAQAVTVPGSSVRT